MSEYVLTKSELYHHGVKGQKWGVRQWQNSDGSLTTAGKIHYGYGKGLDKISSVTGKVTSATRDAARTRKHGRIASSIENRIATASNIAQRNAESLKKISESNDSAFKKALKSASYMAIPKKYTSPDGKTGLRILKGSGYKSNEQKALADQYKTSQAYRTTKTGRYMASVAAKNAESFAKYYENRVNSNSVKEYVHNTFSGFFKTPYTRLTGKQTTIGREIVRTFLTGGLSLAVDAGRVVIGKKGVRSYDDTAYKEMKREKKTKKASEG